MSASPFLQALVAAFLFGAAVPASKALLGPLPPLQLAGLLYLGAALGMLPALDFRDLDAFRRMDPANRRRLAGSIGFGGVLGQVFLLYGLKLASAASVSLWLSLEVVATAILGAIFFRDHMGKIGAAGVLGAFLAALLLAGGEKAAGLEAGALVLLACACWGADNQFTSIIDGASPGQITFWKGLAAGTVNLILGTLTGPWSAGTGTVLAALAAGALCYGVSVSLFIQAARRLGATRAQTIFACAPFFGALLSAAVLGEPLSLVQLTAAAALAASILALSIERHRHEHVHAPMTHEHAHPHDDGHHAHAHSGPPLSAVHSHRHEHEALAHSHPHWPDLHHRHGHKGS